MVWSSEAMRGVTRTYTNGHSSCCMILYDTVYYYMIKEITDSAWMREHM
jgi:hypothetical protein